MSSIANCARVPARLSYCSQHETQWSSRTTYRLLGKYPQQWGVNEKSPTTRPKNNLSKVLGNGFLVLEQTAMHSNESIVVWVRLQCFP